MSFERAPDPDLLLRHWSFVRALARRIATDESTADDLVQETWLAALAGPVANVRSTRGWLAGVLSNLWRERSRGEARRSDRERRAARDEALPPESETIEAAETGRELVGLVLELDEPFRAAVLLRYFHDLPPRAIAERLGVPVRTVNSRLSRGLERVREDWKRRHRGESGGGFGALALLARPPASIAGATTTISIGASVMGMKSILVGAIAVGAVALLFVWSQRTPETEDGQLAALAAAANEAPAEVAAASPVTGASGRVTAAYTSTHTDLPAAPAETALERRAIRGRVLDPEAHPLSGVAIVFRPGGDAAVEGRATSTADGRFELDAPRADGLVTIDDPRLVALCYGRVLSNTALEPLIVAAPFRDLGGRALDEAGLALPGVLVRFVPPQSFRTRFDALFDASEMQNWNAHADENGRFELLRAPIVEQAQLNASLDGYSDATVDAPASETRDLVLVLAKAAIEGAFVCGRVEDPSAAPVPWARVSLGARATMSDAQGNFRLALDGAEQAFELVALRRGALPGRVRASEDPLTRAPHWPDFVVVKLGPPPLSISGRVVDPAGKPIAEMRVWITDPTPFGILRDDVNAMAEFVLASNEPPDSDAELSQAGWFSTRTDEDGRFRLEGLLPRAYSLRLMHPKSLGAMAAGPFEAGTRGVELVFDTGDVHRIAGRIVTRSGTPVENASVRLLSYAYAGVSIGEEVFNTGADGRFEFEGAGKGEFSLWIRGDDLVPVMQAIDVSRASELEIAVTVRCHVKVDWTTAPQAADEIRILGADGSVLQLHEIGPSGETINRSMALVEGRSKSFSVASEARTLVLWKAGGEVRRVPLHLLPGSLNVVRP